MSKKRSLAILCDYGLDDMAATVYLLEHASSFNKIDILAIAGNFPLSVSALNAKRILNSYEKLPENVRLVDTSEIKQFGESIPDIHGSDGMGNVLPPPPADIEERFKAMPYSEWLEGVDESYTVLSLGPCTVTRDILEKKGALPLVMMAGNIAETPNFKGYEFNHALDIQAFAYCVKYEHVTATLDSCHCPQCDFYLISPDANDMIKRIAQKAIELSRTRGETTCRIYDLVAAVYLIHPERYASEVLTDRDGNLVNTLKYISPLPLV